MKDNLVFRMISDLLSLNFTDEDVNEHGVEILQQLHYELSMGNVEIVGVKRGKS